MNGTEVERLMRCLRLRKPLGLLIGRRRVPAGEHMAARCCFTLGYMFLREGNPMKGTIEEVLDLYREEKIDFYEAKKRADMTMSSFADLCRAHGLPLWTVDYPPEELYREFETAKQLFSDVHPYDSDHTLQKRAD